MYHFQTEIIPGYHLDTPVEKQINNYINILSLVIDSYIRVTCMF